MPDAQEEGDGPVRDDVLSTVVESQVHGADRDDGVAPDAFSRRRCGVVGLGFRGAVAGAGGVTEGVR